MPQMIYLKFKPKLQSKKLRIFNYLLTLLAAETKVNLITTWNFIFVAPALSNFTLSKFYAFHLKPTSVTPPCFVYNNFARSSVENFSLCRSSSWFSSLSPPQLFLLSWLHFAGRQGVWIIKSSHRESGEVLTERERERERSHISLSCTLFTMQNILNFVLFILMFFLTLGLSGSWIFFFHYFIICISH